MSKVYKLDGKVITRNSKLLAYDPNHTGDGERARVWLQSLDWLKGDNFLATFGIVVEELELEPTAAELEQQRRTELFLELNALDEKAFAENQTDAANYREFVATSKARAEQSKPHAFGVTTVEQFQAYEDWIYETYTTYQMRKGVPAEQALYTQRPEFPHTQELT